MSFGIWTKGATRDYIIAKLEPHILIHINGFGCKKTFFVLLLMLLSWAIG